MALNQHSSPWGESATGIEGGRVPTRKREVAVPTFPSCCWNTETRLENLCFRMRKPFLKLSVKSDQVEPSQTILDRREWNERLTP